MNVAKKYIAFFNYNEKLKNYFYKKLITKFYNKNGLKDKGENLFMNFINKCSNYIITNDFYNNFLIFKFYLLIFYFKYIELKSFFINISFFETLFFYSNNINKNNIFFKK